MKYESTIQQAIDLIETRLHEDISAEDVASWTGFSKYHFHRIFQAAVGMSAAGYIRMRRLAHAAVSLLQSDERIIDLAMYYHFESQEAFTRAFKKVYHLPPGQYRRLMSKVIQKKEEQVMQTEVKGWILSGSHPFNYEIGVDHEVVHQGSVSGYIKSKETEMPVQFGTMMQEFKADNYIGKRLKLSCFIKTADVQQFAGLWMRVDSVSEEVLQFDNMGNRPITGTNNWNQYAVVLDIPDNSAVISFGVLLNGTGQVWMDQFAFETVDRSVPTTNMEQRSELLDEPVNLSFEDNV